MAGFLLAAAVVSKVAAGWSYTSQAPTNRLAVGLGMMRRDEEGLIFLGLGTQTGVLSPSLEAAILQMVMGTTFLAPVLLRLVLAVGQWPSLSLCPCRTTAVPRGR